MALSQKTAVVTGASTGIGRSIALELAKNNYFVYLLARSRDKLKETEQQIEGHGGKSEYIVADLSNFEGIQVGIRSIKEKTQHVDVLVNVAGIWHGKDEVYSGKPLETFSEQVVIDTYFVGTIAPTLLVHALLPLMQRNSKIVNISGTFEGGAKGWLPYFVSKRAIEDLTIGLAEELADKEIQVNAISPSDVATQEYKKYFPQYIADAIDPLEIAEFAARLCSDQMNDITGKVFVLKKGNQPFEGFHH